MVSHANVLKIVKRKELKKSDTSLPTVPSLLPKVKKNKINFQTSGLDFDDLIQPELPKEYIPEKHDEMISNLGEELMDSLKRHIKDPSRSDNRMNNDDYQILLALLRKKKEKTIEKIPYYLDGYSTNLQAVYRNDRDELYGTEEKEKNLYIKIDNFVKTYIELDQ
jgi:hypothetical protein